MPGSGKYKKIVCFEIWEVLVTILVINGWPNERDKDLIVVGVVCSCLKLRIYLFDGLIVLGYVTCINLLLRNFFLDGAELRK